jgi:hypothetical protein
MRLYLKIASTHISHSRSPRSVRCEVTKTRSRIAKTIRTTAIIACLLVADWFASKVIYGQTSGMLTSAAAPSASRPVIDPNTLVLAAIRQSITGPPIACKVHQQSIAFDQQVVLSGEYKSAGAGTGQFRYTARISSGETTVDTIQVSDGRLMHTQMGELSPTKIVNVEKIREAMTSKIRRIDEHPEVYLHLAIGGQPEILRSLYQKYHWYRSVEGKVGGTDVWQLLGKLRTEPPKLSGTAKIDKDTLALPATTENLPSNVRLTLGRTSNMQYFPYLIEYFRIKKDKDGRAIGLEAVSKIEYSEPVINPKIADTDFVYRCDVTVDKPEWETDLYLPAP